MAESSFAATSTAVSWHKFCRRPRGRVASCSRREPSQIWRKRTKRNTSPSSAKRHRSGIETQAAAELARPTKASTAEPRSLPGNSAGRLRLYVEGPEHDDGRKTGLSYTHRELA